MIRNDMKCCKIRRCGGIFPHRDQCDILLFFFFYCQFGCSHQWSWPSKTAVNPKFHNAICRCSRQQRRQRKTRLGPIQKVPPLHSWLFLIEFVWKLTHHIVRKSQTIHRVTWTTFSVKIVKIQNIFIWFFFRWKK